ncbi:MAG: AtpZ/AtpI family protein [Candidatus Pacebacteria bacterium]|nr:AtpZ/AtpI family protein [Candidatus Paceibacterota bacterium]
MAVIDKKAWREALLVFGRMSGWVATPILIALFLGRWLDAKKGTGNFWFFVLIGVGFLLSVFGIYRESKKYQRALERQEQKEKLEHKQ